MALRRKFGRLFFRANHFTLPVTAAFPFPSSIKVSSRSARLSPWEESDEDCLNMDLFFLVFGCCPAFKRGGDQQLTMPCLLSPASELLSAFEELVFETKAFEELLRSGEEVLGADEEVLGEPPFLATMLATMQSKFQSKRS